MPLLPILRSCKLRPPASEARIEDAERALSRELPDDYKELLHETDGFEGFVGSDSYLLMWSLADVPALNEAYAVADFLPGVTLLGTNGADTGYGFTRRGCEAVAREHRLRSLNCCYAGWRCLDRFIKASRDTGGCRWRSR